MEEEQPTASFLTRLSTMALHKMFWRWAGSCVKYRMLLLLVVHSVEVCCTFFKVLWRGHNEHGLLNICPNGKIGHTFSKNFWNRGVTYLRFSTCHSAGAPVQGILQGLAWWFYCLVFTNVNNLDEESRPQALRLTVSSSLASSNWFLGSHLWVV